MPPYTKPLPPQEENSILTAGINFFDPSFGDESIWGKGDQAILQYLEDNTFEGRWVNFACGDGRYNDTLLSKADSVLAIDIDPGATSKLLHNTPDHLRANLQIQNFDITQPFPLDNNSFDGVFCTGLLHMFPKAVVARTVEELKRIAHDEGTIFFDFATNIERSFMDGTPFQWLNEPAYETDEAISYIEQLFKNYVLEFDFASIQKEVVEFPERPYTFESKLILTTACKRE